MISGYTGALLAIGAPQTPILIIFSALSGSITLLILQDLFQKRVQFSALHAELIDNFLSVAQMRVELETYADSPEQVYLGRSFRNSSLESLKMGSPTLYVKLDESVNDLTLCYQKLEFINSLGDPSIQASLTAEINHDEETIRGGLQEIMQLHVETLRELEGYATSSVGRRILYYNSYRSVENHLGRSVGDDVITDVQRFTANTAE